jgi:hypothetical protein
MMAWIEANAALLALLALVCTSVANHLTAHWSTAGTQVGRILGMISEALSVLASRGVRRPGVGALKWPLTSVRPSSPRDEAPTDPAMLIARRPFIRRRP